MTTSEKTAPKINVPLEDIKKASKVDGKLPIGFEELYLRPFQKKDAPVLTRFYMRNKKNTFFETGVFFFYAETTAEKNQTSLEYIERLQQAAIAGQGISAGLFLRQNGVEVLIGELSLRQRESIYKGINELGEEVFLEPNDWVRGLLIDQKPVDDISYGKRGFTLAAVKAFMNLAHEKGIERVGALINNDNQASLSFSRKMGWESCVELTGVIRREEDRMALNDKMGAMYFSGRVVQMLNHINAILEKPVRNNIIMRAKQR